MIKQFFKKPAVLYLLVYLAAVFPRLCLVLIFLSYPIGLDDMFQYDMLARSIVNQGEYRWYASEDLEVMKPYLRHAVDFNTLELPENGLKTTFRAPGYPTFLAAIYSIGGVQNRIAITRLVQVFITALIAPLVLFLGKKLGLSFKYLLAASLLSGFYPILLMYPIGLGSENIFIPLVILSFLLLLIIKQTGKLLSVIACAITLGLAALTRSVIAPFVFLGIVWLIWHRKAYWKYALVILGIFALITIPWAVRNSLLMEKPTFIETSMGYNLFIGYHPEGHGGFYSKAAMIPVTIFDDAERDQFCVEQAIEFIKNDPLEAVHKVLNRAAFFVGVEDKELTFFYSGNFFGEIPQPWLLTLYILLVTPWLFVSFFSIIGIRFNQNTDINMLLLLFLVGYVPPHLLIMSEPRFHLVLLPIMIPFAFLGWQNRKQFPLLFKFQQADKWKNIATLICMLVLLGLIILGFILKWENLTAIMQPGGNQLYFSY